ncbi:TetR family transcriptional regulator [Intrasporangium chromatireducens Q5-1]|uniref:TetR family transcriptional regulator n=1 Tax=Intrasporangium chromatireducens Q5-1 TaxID=584657 RepID=W9GSS6_9MICO|nr:TetR/AcrR family transcriptional regulator [Intrasporangium chromatireducens]EWT07883.1 TetR family transcriptional regulator [Intrasporangium chromatireducens Q5-1]
MAGTPTQRTRVPRAEREAQMLEVAEEVFVARGIQAATMDEIAERVGVTKPLIYDYFGSKEGLLAASIERGRRQLLGLIIDAWSAQPDLEVRDRLRAVVLAFFTFIDEHDRMFALLRTEGSLVGPAAESVERIRQQTAKAFAEGLRSLPAFDQLPSSRVTGMAELLIGACDRLAVSRVMTPGLSAGDAADLVMTTMWDGLGSIASDGR